MEAAFLVIVGIGNDKVAYEHILWGQANVLVQIDLLDPAAHAAHGFHWQNQPETTTKTMHRIAATGTHDAYVQRLRQESSMIKNVTDQG